MNRPAPRSAKTTPRRSRSRHHRGRQVAIVTGLGCLIALGILFVRAVESDVRTAAPVKTETASATGQRDGETYTGSILYLPFSGRLCRQHLFDNLTGQLSDNGSVDCEKAAYRSPNGSAKNWSVARTNIISYSFRRH